MEARIAVLVSGSGTNLQALLDDPVIRPHIELVLSDRDGVRSLERARGAGIETAVTMDATEAYRKIRKTAIQTPAPISPTNGARVK
jgi:folate-dependent phosphoribosylglycinamide formyltransferase PurN